MSESKPDLLAGSVNDECLNTLYAALALAQSKFPALPRTATGQVGKERKFQYAPYHKVVQCIKQPLIEHGLGFIQPIHTEEDGYVSVSLIVFGHGAVIASKLKFKKNDNVKDFGADCTYHRRYQLTSFFGLEGDPDADDFDIVDDVPTKVSEPVQVKPRTSETDASTGMEVQARLSSVQNTPETNSGKKEDDKTSATNIATKQADTRSIGQKLTDAMKQLDWKMENFDAFCKENPQDFPDFISAAKLSPNGKQKLYELLLIKKNLAPF